jgi:hypothetical protein
MDWEEESPETEEDNIRAEALRRLKVRQQLQGQRDRIRASSQPQKEMSNSEYDQQFAEAMALKLRLNREQRSANSEESVLVSEQSAPSGDLRQEMEWDPNGPETEEDAIRSEALRRLKVRRLFQEQPDPTRG